MSLSSPNDPGAEIAGFRHRPAASESLSFPRMLALTALSGALATLAMAPFQWPLASYLSLWPLFYLCQRLRNSLTGLLAAGLLSSFFCSVFAFHWFVLTIENFGRPGLVGATAIFIPLAFVFQLKFVVFVVAFGFSRRIKLEPGWLAAATLGAVTDLCTPNLFPWYWGNLLAGNVYFAQLSEFVGPAGLSFILFAISYESYRGAAAFQRGVFRWRRVSRGLLVAALAILCLGAVRFYQWRTYQANAPRMRVAMLQTNAPLERTTAEAQRSPEVERTALELMRDVIPELAREARATAARESPKGSAKQSAGEVSKQSRIDLIVLPESAVPYYTTDAHYLNRRFRIFHEDFLALARELSGGDEASALILNETNFRVHEFENGGRIRARAYNSAALFLDGEAVGEYRKGRLLPFGEYAPGESLWRKLGLADYLPAFLQNSRFYPGDFDTNGSFRIPLRSAGAPETMDRAHRVRRPLHVQALPTICYEIIFPDYIREFLRISSRSANDAPGLLVNITQDGWYGDTIEIHQHFELARMRSIETRRALVRANNTGQSGFVDLTGRIVAPLNADTAPREFAERGVLIQDVPIQNEYTTLYMRIGDWWLLLPLLATAWLFARRARQPSSQG